MERAEERLARVPLNGLNLKGAAIARGETKRRVFTRRRLLPSPAARNRNRQNEVRTPLYLVAEEGRQENGRTHFTKCSDMGAARLFANDHVDAVGKVANLLRLTRQPGNNRRNRQSETDKQRVGIARKCNVHSALMIRRHGLIHVQVAQRNRPLLASDINGHGPVA